MPPAKSVRADLEAFRAKRRPAEPSQPEVAQVSVADVSGESGGSVEEVLQTVSDDEGNLPDTRTGEVIFRTAPRDNTKPER